MFYKEVDKVSWIDDHYEDLIREEMDFQNSAQELIEDHSPQEIVDIVISMFKPAFIDQYGEIDDIDDREKAKAILKTVARQKRVSEKQKKFFCYFIVRNHPEYMYGY